MIFRSTIIFFIVGLLTFVSFGYAQASVESEETQLEIKQWSDREFDRLFSVSPAGLMAGFKIVMRGRVLFVVDSRTGTEALENKDVKVFIEVISGYKGADSGEIIVVQLESDMFGASLNRTINTWFFKRKLSKETSGDLAYYSGLMDRLTEENPQVMPELKRRVNQALALKEIYVDNAALFSDSHSLPFTMRSVNVINEGSEVFLMLSDGHENIDTDGEKFFEIPSFDRTNLFINDDVDRLSEFFESQNRE